MIWYLWLLALIYLLQIVFNITNHKAKWNTIAIRYVTAIMCCSIAGQQQLSCATEDRKKLAAYEQLFELDAVI